MNGDSSGVVGVDKRRDRPIATPWQTWQAGSPPRLSTSKWPTYVPNEGCCGRASSPIHADRAAAHGSHDAGGRRPQAAAEEQLPCRHHRSRDEGVLLQPGLSTATSKAGCLNDQPFHHTQPGPPPVGPFAAVACVLCARAVQAVCERGRVEGGCEMMMTIRACVGSQVSAPNQTSFERI